MLSCRSGMFILPYSPRWLAKQGRHDEGRATLIRLHGGRKNAQTNVVEAEYAEILNQIEWGEWSDPFGSWFLLTPYSL